jgi:hypothetical protein
MNPWSILKTVLFGSKRSKTPALKPYSGLDYDAIRETVERHRRDELAEGLVSANERRQSRPDDEN